MGTNPLYSPEIGVIESYTLMDNWKIKVVGRIGRCRRSGSIKCDITSTNVTLWLKRVSLATFWNVFRQRCIWLWKLSVDKNIGYRFVPCCAVLEHTIPSHPIPSHTIPYHAMPCRAAPRRATSRHATPHHTTPHHAIPSHTLPGQAMPCPCPCPCPSPCSALCCVVSYDISGLKSNVSENLKYILHPFDKCK